MTQNEWVSVEPEIWKPEQAGDSIEGVLIYKRERGGKFNKESYYLENSGKSFMVFGTTVLENRMKLVDVGDFIKIEYKGLEKNKRNEDTKIFQVFKRPKSDIVKEKPEEGITPSSEIKIFDPFAPPFCQDDLQISYQRKNPNFKGF